MYKERQREKERSGTGREGERLKCKPDLKIRKE
jgi:hypothetical protein